MQKNSKCWLCGDKDETVNHLCECNRLTQKKYMSRHD